MTSWIKLHRSLLNWEWFNDPKTLSLFIYCLLKANYEDKQWRGVTVPRGSFITSLNNLSTATGLSIKEVRVRLNRLSDGAVIGQEKGKAYTLVTICKYDDYQLNEKLGAKKGQEKGSQRATTKEVKNNSIDKSIHIDYDKLKDTYNAVCTKLPKCKIVSDDRRGAIRKCVNQVGKEGLLEIMQKANASKFLTGDNDRKWRANFDFILHPKQSIRILEGFYDNNKGNSINWNLTIQ